MESYFRLVVILIPILIIDLINPVLLVAVLYGLGSRRPMTNGILICLSYFAAYLVSGVVVALLLEGFIKVFHLPLGFDYVIELVVALLLLWMGWSMLKSGDTHLERELPHEGRMKFIHAIVLGIQVNFVGLPLAVPYLAAIDQILISGIGFTALIMMLFFYNLLYILPFLSMIFLQWFLHEKSKPILQKFNRIMHLISVKYLPWVFIVLAFLLLEDCVSFFLGYREYSFLSFF